jgi:IS30 family transposase
VKSSFTQYQQKNKHIKLTAEIKHYISKKLKEYWSPEQIVECLELNEKVKISTATTYRFVLQNKAVGGARLLMKWLYYIVVRILKNNNILYVLYTMICALCNGRLHYSVGFSWGYF